jgi:allophanate hydrolase
VAERLAAIEPFVTDHPDALHPVTARIIEGARDHTAVDAFRGQYRLQELRRATEPTWDDIDVLVVPTAGTTYTIAEVEADPLALNANLGHYTNFVNLLGLAALAVPASLTPQGRPFGVTLIGPGGSDEHLAGLGGAFHAASGLPMGATGVPLPTAAPEPPVARAAAQTPSVASLAVVGAHLSGQPLNHQLTDLGATLEQRTTTAACYRLYDLDGTRPGMVRVPDAGAAIEVEVWQVATDRLGALLVQVPSPLTLGTVELASGRPVLGFLCERHATQDAVDVTHHGSWPRYLVSRGSVRGANMLATPRPPTRSGSRP